MVLAIQHQISGGVQLGIGRWAMHRSPAWIAGLVLAVSLPVAAQPRTRQVLLLNSFERGSATENLFASMLRAELRRGSPEPINFFEVSLQPALALDRPREESAVSYLESTFGQKLDLVVALGGPAAEFAQEHRERTFPATPLMLTAMDHRWVQGRHLTPQETALPVVMNPESILEDMLRLLPDTTHVFVVIGGSRIEQLWREELMRRFQPFAGRVAFDWSSALSFEQTLQRASGLPPRSAIFYALFVVDAKGVAQEEERTLAGLRAVANAPMFGLYDIQVGNGIVGGPVLSVAEAVRNAAAVARRILDGQPAGDIKTPAQEHGQPTYDWRELRRWGISEARLPAGSAIRFRQPGLWDQYSTYIITAAAILVVQSMLIAGLAVQRVRRRGAERALRRSYEQNQDLVGRLIDAQEEERKRIARDLHDDLSQQLAGVAIVLSGLKARVGVSGLSEVEATVGSLQARTFTLAESVRNLSHALHPAVLQHAGLVATLRRHCAEIERDHRVPVTFHAGEILDPLRPDVALCLFRVAQEAIANAVHHGRPRTIAVQLMATGNHIVLRVVDDGTGFDVGERAGTGLGLRSMDERVRITHGTVEVDSRPGQGATVLVRIPSPAFAERAGFKR